MNDDTDGQDKDGQDDAGNTGDATGTKDADKPKSFTEADVEDIVKKRLLRERTKIAADVKKELTDAAALEKAKADGDLQKVIESQKSELDQYNALKPILVEYEELAEQRYQDALKSLPEALRLLAPDDEATALDKERWLTKKALPAAAKLKTSDDKSDANGKPKPGNNPPGLEPLSQTSKKTIDDIIKAYRGRGSYRPLM